MISGDVLKYRNGFLIEGRYKTRLTSSRRFPLTLPTEELRPAQKFYALPYSAPPEKQRVIESPKWEMYRAGRALKEDRAGFRVENMKVFNVNANTTRIPRLPQFGNLALDRHAILAKLSLDQHVAAKRLGDENFR